jgi:hypothetical protein
MQLVSGYLTGHLIPLLSYYLCILDDYSALGKCCYFNFFFGYVFFSPRLAAFFPSNIPDLCSEAISEVRSMLDISHLMLDEVRNIQQRFVYVTIVLLECLKNELL